MLNWLVVLAGISLFALGFVLCLFLSELHRKFKRAFGHRYVMHIYTIPDKKEDIQVYKLCASHFCHCHGVYKWNFYHREWKPQGPKGKKRFRHLATNEQCYFIETSIASRRMN